VQQTVSASGTLEPATEADLSFQSAGTVNSVGVSVGQQVTKGEVLASIDTSALQGQVTLAQAVVTQAQAQVTAAGSSGSASQIAAADAQLASAQAKLLAAQQALSQARLTSPIDGVVAAVAVKVGSTVGGSGTSGSSGSSSSGAGRVASSGGTGGSAAGPGGTAGTGGAGASGSSSAAISVISTNAWIVQTQVGNADLASLKQGMQAQILPTGSRATIYGTVESIGIVASSSSSGTSQFPVTIAVTGAPAGLYAGTAASVSIIVKQMDDVLTVPISPEELLARVLAITRRTYGQTFPLKPILVLGQLEIDIVNHRVRVGSSEVHLTETEQSLLYLLAANAGEVVTSEEILTAVWGADYTSEDDVVERLIVSLRLKLQNGWPEPRFIVTFPGVGYRFLPVVEQLVSVS